MSDDDLLIKPQEPKRSWIERIHWQTWISVISLAVSLSSAIFTCQQVKLGDRQARAAEDQATVAKQALQDARQASQDQRSDVERARIAAENSAHAAKKLADGMERSARASEMSASAGRESLLLNRRSLILSNQPEIAIQEVRLSKVLAFKEKPVVSIQIVNAGRGKALKLKNRGWFSLSPERVFQYTSLATPPSTGDLSSNGILRLSIEMQTSLTEDAIEKVNRGDLTLYVYGVSEYYDNTLDAQRKYLTRWCAFYKSAPRDKLVLHLCPEHNDTTIQ